MAEHNWEDVRLFLALYRHQTMGAAAAALRLDTSTVSRRLAALEEAVGAVLFDRGRHGMRPTAAAHALSAAAYAVEAGVLDFGDAVDGLQGDVAGLVRLACPPDVAEVIVLPVVERLTARYPSLEVVLLPGESSVDLARREADLALRIVKPTTGELQVLRLVDVAWVPAAAPALASQVGEAAALSALPWVAWAQGPMRERLGPWFEQHVTSVVLRTNHLTTQFAAAKRGMAAAVLPERSLAHYGLVALPKPSDSHTLPVDTLYLLAHAAVRQTPRVTAVWDALVEAFAEAK